MQSTSAVAREIHRFREHVARVVLAPAAPDPVAEGSWGRDLCCVVLFGAVAGLAMGLFTGGLQALYVPTKVPLLLGGSFLIGFPSMVVLGRVLGCPLGFRAAGRLALATIARTAVVLGALAPVTACFSLSLPRGGRGSYQTVVLVQVAATAIAGFAGVTALRGRLRTVVPDRRARLLTTAVWIGIYSFVGAQLTWLLRPFLATPGLPLEYLRSYEALGIESNFYVSVLRLVSGWLVSG